MLYGTRKSGANLKRQQWLWWQLKSGNITVDNSKDNNNSRNNMPKLKSDFDILPTEREIRKNITTTNIITTTTTILWSIQAIVMHRWLKLLKLLLMWLLAASMTAHCFSQGTAATTTTTTTTTMAIPHTTGNNKTTDGMNNNNNNDNNSSSSSNNRDHHNGWRLISRHAWKAQTPKAIVHFSLPIDYVIIHHSYQPGICATTDACMASMRSMQQFHMAYNNWSDIGYSFAVGGDGNVYVGRGFGVVGAHAPNYNNRSIGLLLIGNFEVQLPPAWMVEVASRFLQYAVDLGVLRANYILYGHRQVRNTSCPGDMLYERIKLWPHWHIR